MSKSGKKAKKALRKAAAEHRRAQESSATDPAQPMLVKVPGSDPFAPGWEPPPPVERTIFFTKAKRFGPRYVRFASGTMLRTPEMRAIAGSLHRNVMRLVTMADSTEYLMQMSAYRQLCMSRAVHQILGKVAFDDPADNDRTEEVRALFEKLLEENIHDVDQFKTIGTIIDWLANMPGLGIYEGMSAIFAAIVIGAWTLFETIAKDIWTSAANARPRYFGSNKKVAGEKTFQFESLEQYDFDVLNNMGFILRVKFGFDSMEGSLKAYEAAFGEDRNFTKVFRLPSLRTANAIRNVMIHKGGLADLDFINDVRGVRRWSAVNIDDEVLLDGKVVSVLAWACIKSSLTLLAGVDHWLHNYPDLQPSASSGSR